MNSVSPAPSRPDRNSRHTGTVLSPSSARSTVNQREQKVPVSRSLPSGRISYT